MFPLARTLVLVAAVLLAPPALAQTMPVTTSSEEARAHFERGREAAFHWNVTTAHQHLDAALAADPGLVLAYLHRAGTSRPAERQQYFDRARPYLETVTDAERRFVEAFRAFLIDHEYDRAVTLFQGLMAEYPEDHHLPGYLGLRYYMNLQRYDEAVEQFERALELNLDFSQAHNFLGHVALSQGEFEAAEEFFRRYLEMAPDEPQPYRSLGELYHAQGNYDKAAVYFEQVLERDPDFFGAWVRPGWMRDILGQMYVRARRYDKAERVFRENIRLHTDDPHAHDALGRLYLLTDRISDATALFERALTLDPGFSTSREHIDLARAAAVREGKRLMPVTTSSPQAREHFELGRHAAFHYQNAAAQEHLDAAIAADSHFVLAYLHRGGMSTFLERGPFFEAARANRERVTPAEQRMIDAFHAFLWEGDVPRAVEIFNELAEEFPDDPYLPGYLGLRYYWNLQQYDDARAQFERALRRDPSFSQGYNWLGYTALSQEDYDAAREAFQRYLELAPDQPRPYHSMGLLYWRVGEHEEAARYFERSTRVDSRFFQGREALMRLRIEQANQDFQEAVVRQDAAAVAAIYTPNAQIMPPFLPPLTGTAIEEFWREQFGNGIRGLTIETSEVIVGDPDFLTTELGRFEIVYDEGGTDSGSYVVIWARTADGWKRHRHMLVSDGL